MAGSFVGQAPLRQLFWMLDGAGIIVACALLTVKFFRKGNDGLAASFLLFLAAESLVLSNTAAGLEVSRASFASGIALWAASPLMISATNTLPKWSRVTALVAAALFTVTAVKIGSGDSLVATSAPLPSGGREPAIRRSELSRVGRPGRRALSRSAALAPSFRRAAVGAHALVLP